MSGASSLLPICLVDEDLRRLCALLFSKLHIGALFEAVIRPPPPPVFSLRFNVCVAADSVRCSVPKPISRSVSLGSITWSSKLLLVLALLPRTYQDLGSLISTTIMGQGDLLYFSV